MSKLQRLRDNIAAIECALKGENNAEVLGKYTGFGGLGFVLNPIDNKAAWNKTDLTCYEDTVRLHNILKEHSKNDSDYKCWMQSLKASTLTAYYTPAVLTAALFKTIIKDCGFEPDTFLDPAAGATGKFLLNASHGCKLYAHEPKCVAFEKDLLSGLILERLTANDDKIIVHTKGFEEITEQTLGRFDMVATNVPFGDIKVYDPLFTSPVRKEALKMIHRYYVLKGLDCLRDGGILAYIITSNYLNNDSEQVQEALKQARLIGAYRLANNLFKENGTEVGTDLLVLQKDVNKGELTEDEKALTKVIVTKEGCPTNMYFVRHRECLIADSGAIGTDAYGKTAVIYQHSGGVKGIAEQLSTVLATDMAKSLTPDPSPKGEGGKPETRNLKPETNQPETKAKRMTKQEVAMQTLHGCFLTLESNERTQQTEDAESRKNLNALYDEYVSSYGYLNEAKNKQIAKRLGIVDVLALEVKTEVSSEWQKADIFFKPVAFSTAEPLSTLTANEALAASLNEYGYPDMEYMSERTGLTLIELLDNLRGSVYLNPMLRKYEIKAKFVSGNVIEKIEQVERARQEIETMKPAKGLLDNNGQWEAMKALLLKETDVSLQALKDAIPTPIAFADLDFNLGERWVSDKIYAAFASDFFSMPDDRAEVKVKYMPEADQYVVSCSSWNARVRTLYSVTSETGNKVDGVDLLTHALHNSTPKMMRYKRNEHGRILTKINSKGETEYIKEEDPAALQLVNTKIEEIRDGYTEWLNNQPKELRDKLAEEYNKRFNCFVKPVYDGSHQTFPDLDREAIREKYGVEDLYKSQKDCIWMLLLNGGGICDHEVGGGKTFIMCIAAHEMKRLGMCHKPMIIGLKANVGAIAETYRTCYPKAKVLFATEKDYSAANRVDFFNRMKTGDWDVIIMSHDQFGRIPQSLEVQKQIVYEELQRVEDALDAVSREEGWDISNKMLKGLEKRKANLNAKLTKLLDTLKKKKDDVTDFEQLGIDHLFVDESHQFKNLGFTTRHNRVAGLGNTEGSQRAFDMLIAIRTIQSRTGKDLGATFLSGTTVTNSLTELYLLFNYLRPKALEKQRITCFDAWAAIFTKKSAEYEFSITNAIVMKERFRYFIKVPELAMFYNEITDFKTAEDIGIVRPKSDPVLLNLKPTKDQEAYIQTLMKFAMTGDFSLIGIDNPTQQQKNAKMLYATDLARKMSLDMRLIDPLYGDDPGNKVSRCAEKIWQWYKAFDAMKGTQLVFSDLSTWDSSKWNVYGAIRDKLVDEYGIPKDEIRFIQEAKNDEKKQEIVKLVNEGKVRVLFGSTSMLGTGVNAQKRVVAVHHLDTPWRPSDLEQRDGRAIRKGNEVAADWQDNKVKVIIYAVERSLDSYKFNLLHLKHVFINQLKRGQLNVRTLDEGAMDEKSGMNFAEYMAVLSGNTDLLERAKIEKKIAALEGERKSFYRERHSQEDKHALLTKQAEFLRKNIESSKADWEKFEGVCETDAEGYALNKIVIDGFAIDTTLMPEGSKEWTAAVARELIRIDNDTTLLPGEYRTVGNIYGFPIILKTDTVGSTFINGNEVPTYRNKWFVHGEQILHTARTERGDDNGYLNHGNLQKCADYALTCLLSIPARIEQWQKNIDYNQHSIKQLESILSVEWGKDDALKQLKQDLQEIDKRLGDSLKKTDGDQKDLVTKTEDLPYKFSLDRGDTVVTFKRSDVSLVSVSEMKQIAERLTEGEISYARKHWCISDGWDWRGEYRNRDEVSAEFTVGEKAEEFVLTVFRLQDERKADKAWLTEHAALASNGTDVTRENETILAARKLIGVKTAA